jgi:hypothetical protein
VKTIRFPYLRYLVSPDGVVPSQYVYRPVIPVKLSAGKKSVVFDGLIDSGADESTFPGWILKALGKNIHQGRQRIFKGIGGSVLAYSHKTYLQVDCHKILIDAYYSHEWDDMPFGLLGQASFFSHLRVAFDYRRKIIAIS